MSSSNAKRPTAIGVPPDKDVQPTYNGLLLYRVQFWRKKPGWLLCYYKPVG